MEDERTKIKSIFIIVIAWLMAIALLYLVIIKIKLLFH
jgi:hypothetical protein